MSHQHNKRSLIGFFFSKISNEQDNYEVKRENMVKIQLMERGINDPDTLRAMRQVERHEFVPEKMKKGAYSDSPMSIGHYQTISQPYIVGYMTQALKLKPEHRVLEIGTGSGYQAAVLATIVASVYTIEIVEPLGIVAKKRFQDLGYDNIRTTIGDGYHGWPDEAPFNAIIVTAAVKKIPTALIDQLAEGGRMIIPVRHSDLRYYLVLVTKKNGEISYKKLIPVAFVPFTRNTD
ncbi:MAG: protein-L-isoaspartate(D-aspartate) O-methyltransferase [Bacteroidia bacterium]|nr:protein-L-isoaspartate(D-aspartate) O-methyltransferase [Bacteroidia bacterium]NND24592.1 protein-L-isoaspartate(D-aspartate) O-methyltransferase [Flavobacteriaceae bacterium]RZW44852.1 MAG: protein-L-isoaspartate(D-aspartate) O-methyltransferase [Flavobacteriaceae bacterium]